MVSEVFTEPPVFVAVMVKFVSVMFTSGVPETVPLTKMSPSGRSGLMDHVSTNPPSEIEVAFSISS